MCICKVCRYVYICVYIQKIYTHISHPNAGNTPFDPLHLLLARVVDLLQLQLQLQVQCCNVTMLQVLLLLLRLLITTTTYYYY